MELAVVVYLLKNIMNGKGYVGITTKPLSARWAVHRWDAMRKRRKNYPVLSAIRKYGPDVWSVELLEECGSLEQLKLREVAWISGLGTHISTGDGYNVSWGGDAAMAGRRHSEESKAKISASHVGIGHSDETRSKMSASRRGRVTSQETRSRQSAAHQGKKKSPETVERMRSAAKKRESLKRLSKEDPCH